MKRLTIGKFVFLLLLVTPAYIDAGLRDIAASNGFSYGCAASMNDLQADPDFAQAVAQECGTLTPTVGLKMDSIAIAPNIYDFSQGDWLQAFADQRGQTMIGHTLVWYKKVPAFIQRYSQQELRDWLILYTSAVVSHFSKVRLWTVINEPLPEDGDQWYQDRLGSAWIDAALQGAHQSCPSCELSVSDWGLEYKEKQGRFLAWLHPLLLRGVPITTVEIQGHLQSSFDDSTGLASFCQQLRRLGLNVVVSELDVADRSHVASAYRHFLIGVLSGGVKQVTTWGLSDRYFNHARLVADARPLPLNRNLHPKPAYNVLVKAFLR